MHNRFLGVGLCGEASVRGVGSPCGNSHVLCWDFHVLTSHVLMGCVTITCVLCLALPRGAISILLTEPRAFTLSMNVLCLAPPRGAMSILLTERSV